MALSTIGSKVGTNAIFQTPSGVSSGCQGAQGIDACHVRVEVTGLIESRDLIVCYSAVIVVPIELRCVEAQGPAGYVRVTVQAFTAAGIVPNSCVRFTLILNVNILVQAFFGYQRGVGLRVAPAVSQAIDSLGSADQETSFNSAQGVRHSIRELQFEMFDPDHAGWKGPRS